MQQLSRRKFLAAGAACTAAGFGGSLLPADASAQPAPAGEKIVRFFGDGPFLSPTEYANLLVTLTQSGKAKGDLYLAGGAVAELETRFAQELGKEKAVFVPTGTLANHLALRRLAAGNSRVLLQAECHVYCDAFDCVPTLSHLNLVPLAAGRATFTLSEVEEACARAKNGPHPVQVGAISIECPVRRQRGAVFDFEEMKRIGAYARKNHIGLHLDGARVYIAAAYTGIPVRDYAALFDTVYVSLYKYFGAGTGAVLAGPRALIEQVARDRMMFGGGLFQAWPYAAVALHFLDGFTERFKKAQEAGEALFHELAKHPRFRVERIVGGTNIARLHVDGIESGAFAKALRNAGIIINSRPKSSEIDLTINETLLKRPVADVAAAFVVALGK